MKIVVCIKQVPDTNEIKLDPVTGTLIRAGVPSIMNHDDKSGLELALRLKDKFGAHITVITMGPGQADAILREAYAMGADRAILLTDKKFAGADTLATSNALAGALRNIEHDLIIAGRQAIDGDTAQVGPQLAEHLDLPHVSYLRKLDYDGKGTFTMERVTEDGYEELEVDAPCLVTVLSSANKPRYMTVRGIVETHGRDVEIWGYENIAVEEEKLGLKGSPTSVHKSFSKGLKASGETYEVGADEAVGIIMSRLKEKFII